MLFCRVFFDDLALCFVPLSRFGKRLVELPLFFFPQIGLALFHCSVSSSLVVLGGTRAASSWPGGGLLGFPAAFLLLPASATGELPAAISTFHAF
jgi:hypothetical protein